MDLAGKNWNCLLWRKAAPAVHKQARTAKCHWHHSGTWKKRRGEEVISPEGKGLFKNTSDLHLNFMPNSVIQRTQPCFSNGLKWTTNTAALKHHGHILHMCKLLPLPPQPMVSWAISYSPFSSNLSVAELLCDFANKPNKKIITKPPRLVQHYDYINRFTSHLLCLGLYVIFIWCHSIRPENLLFNWFYGTNCALRKCKKCKTWLGFCS